MNIKTALRIVGMTKMALTEKFGGVAKGLAKRIQAGQVVRKSGLKLGSSKTAAKNIVGGKKYGKTQAKMSKSRRKAREASKEREAMLGYERKQKQKSDDAYAQYRDHFDEKGHRLD